MRPSSGDGIGNTRGIGRAGRSADAVMPSRRLFDRTAEPSQLLEQAQTPETFGSKRSQPPARPESAKRMSKHETALQHAWGRQHGDPVKRPIRLMLQYFSPGYKRR